MAKFDVLNPFQPLDTPYRVRRAFEFGEAAAFVLAAYNILTAIVIYSRTKPFNALLGSNPHTIWLLHLAFAAAGVALGLAIRRHRSTWACWIVFAWTVIEGLGLPGLLYAHNVSILLRLIVFVAALPGVRAVYARQDPGRRDDDSSK